MSVSHNSYYDVHAVEQAVAAGRHRDVVGGMWEVIGKLQLDFLVRRGLRPEHRLLDVGCGALRGGVFFVRYLDPSRYFGLDLNRRLLDAGYDREILPAGLEARLPRRNLIDAPDFDVGRFPERFEFALAVSVFTHLPLDLIRVCLEQLPRCMCTGGRFFATFFQAPEDQPTSIAITHPPGLITTHAGRDPYHHRFSDYRHLCSGLPWTAELLGDFGHPRGQRMIQFTME